MEMIEGGAHAPEELGLIVDGHNLFFRSFSSVPRTITTLDGTSVNAVYGFVNTIIRLLRNHSPTYLAVAFDVPDVPTFRHALFPNYQGQRGRLGGDHADNFKWQVEQVLRVLDHMRISTLSLAGFEADDILGTLARRLSHESVGVLMVSSDRDLFQLVDAGVRVLVPGKQETIVDKASVQSRLGLCPSQIVDWKAMAGDASDNIPGVRGIGNKMALSILAQCGSIENAYRDLEKLPPRPRTLLENGRADAEFFQQIVRIRTDLELPLALNQLKIAYNHLPSRATDELRALALLPHKETP